VLATADRSMERRCSDLVADVHQAWMFVEQPADPDISPFVRLPRRVARLCLTAVR
jgi:hypothetical protein